MTNAATNTTAIVFGGAGQSHPVTNVFMMTSMIVTAMALKLSRGGIIFFLGRNRPLLFRFRRFRQFAFGLVGQRKADFGLEQERSEFSHPITPLFGGYVVANAPIFDV